MIKKIQHTLYVLFILGASLLGRAVTASETWALVKVPITDLTSKDLTYFEDLPYAYYHKFPYSPEGGTNQCLRLHQLKFNELVKIHDVSENGVRCEVESFFCRQNETDSKTFWALKEDFLFLNDLSPDTELVSHIPPPYKIGQSPSLSNHNVLTLTQPWLDQETDTTYSAGTRFVRNASQDTANSYAISMIDVQLGTSVVKHIDRSLALVTYPQDPSKAAELFVQLLKKWATTQEGILPYVWGGCSHTGNRASDDFSLVSYKDISTFWQREPVPMGTFSGFDCSGLVLCAAQICGIPYFFKNTTTMLACMKPLKEGKTLKEGDLIWSPRHVMVVSDREKNMLIEAVGYSAGYGKVHEISVDKAFKGIHNLSELTTAYEQQTPLERLNSKGVVSTTTPFTIKILSLKSLWKTIEH